MSGHSKWANIKNKKGKTDAQRGKIFTKLGRELMVAVKEGGPDPLANSKLRDIIAKCKANNMPNDNIDRGIKKAAGEGSASTYEEITYEGYGPGGIAIIVETLTDNKNRTAADVRHIFDKFGGNMGTAGCVSYMFHKKGIIIIERTVKTSEEELMTIALESGADDINTEIEYFEIVTSLENFSTVREQLEKNNYSFIEAEVKMVPEMYATVSEEFENKLNILIEKLEDNDDVQQVWTNIEE